MTRRDVLLAAVWLTAYAALVANLIATTAGGPR